MDPLLLNRLLKLYTEFKKWTESPDATTKRFTIENNSFDNPQLLQNIKQTTSTMQLYSAIIIGLIYPLSEPFIKHALRVEIHVPLTFPQVPPTVYMKTEIRHPNIEKDGRICSTLLDRTKTWNYLSLDKVVTLITKLIDDPELTCVIDAEISALYDSDRIQYNEVLTKSVRAHGIPLT